MKRLFIEEGEEKEIIIYHCVLKNEHFEDAVDSLLYLLRNAQRQFPNRIRNLFLDIEGHRHPDGALDSEMWEFISDFMLDMHERNPLKGGFKKFFKKWSIAGPSRDFISGEQVQDNNIPQVKIMNPESH